MKKKMRWTKFVAFLSCLALFTSANAKEDVSRRSILSTLRVPHPRLITLSDDIARIKQSIGKDPVAKKLFDVLKQRADEFIVAQVPKYSSNNAQGLAASRLALKHITTLAGMFRLSGEMKYADRAKQEMLEIACFSDWAPAHFLNVAEMTAAMGIGYDWLYDQLSADERGIVRRAIIRNGLQPGLNEYEKAAWWTTAATNWNFVCNGGLTLGALAIADDERELSEKILKNSLNSVPFALKTFSPDGGWPEGPGYWAYGTRYLTYLLTSLQSSIGSDFDLSGKPGVSETGFFRIYSEGPLGLSFNFGDSETEVPRGAQMFWFARRFKQPVFAGAELHVAEVFPEMFHLLFYTSEHLTPAQAHLPLNRIFTGVNVALFRSAWNDQKAFFVGFKGGENHWSHSHADLGSFVFDAAGYRWAEDLGPDSYDLPGYFKENHFTYYRLQTQAHNTLTIDNENQPKEGSAKIVRSSSSEDHPFAIVDLNLAYPGRFSEIKRGIALVDGKQLVVQDEFQATRAIKKLTWHFHTRSSVKILPGGKTAVLRKGEGAGAIELKAEIVSPPGVLFTCEQFESPEGQAQQPDVSDLSTSLNDVDAKIPIRLTVVFSANNAGMSEVKPLSQW